MPWPSVPALRARSVARIAVGISLALSLAGCAGTPVGSRTTPSPQPSGPTASSSLSSGSTSATPVTVPGDGSTLAALGFTNGPLKTFSVPAAAYVSASSDQPSLVTVVLASPSPRAVYGYLVGALPAAGYTVTAQSGPTGGQGLALSFTGHGWTGEFTGAGSTSAVTLRPVG